MMAVRQSEPVLRGELREHEPMARHTTWRVGGPVDRWYRPADLADLALFLAGLPAHEPLHWVGLGSNLLVRDGGIRGTLIATAGTLAAIERVGATQVRAGAGAACARLARFCAREGLSGGEFWAGIPGTVGGALAMNAGCFGGETWARVTAVTTIDRQGVVRERPAQAFEAGYRQVRGPAGEWFVAALFQLGEAPAADDAAGRMREYLDRRAASQPLGQANAGSVFRNPPGDHAGRLIEAAGLTGHCVGGACVSEKHANFIINGGNARAADIEALIGEVRATVAARFGVQLETEVRILGEAGEAGA
jgi:UDP-N-acetylmuramate dehydrogenase